MKCKRCGKGAEDGQLRCGYCGAPIDEEEYIPEDYSIQLIYGPPPELPENDDDTYDTLFDILKRKKPKDITEGENK